jgi:imidazoleglycerol-phosphate dehydratase
MLSMVARHGFYDLEVHATGDLDVDYHHTVEDVGICLGRPSTRRWGRSRACGAMPRQVYLWKRPWPLP